MRNLLRALIVILLFSGLANANPPGTYNQLLLNAGGVNITWQYQAQDSAGVCTSCSFAGATFGPASSSRVIAVGVAWVNVGGGTIDTMTIGGISATKQISVTRSATVYANEIWSAVVPTGTSGTIVVGISASADTIGISVWNILGSNGATAFATSSDGDGSNPQTCSLNVQANGGAVGLALTNSLKTYTWTGLTESFDISWNGNGTSAATGNFGPAQTPLAVTATQSSADTNVVTSCASWSPS